MRTTTGAAAGTTITWRVYRPASAPATVGVIPYVSNSGWSNSYGPQQSLAGAGWDTVPPHRARRHGRPAAGARPADRRSRLDRIAVRRRRHLVTADHDRVNARRYAAPRLARAPRRLPA